MSSSWSGEVMIVQLAVQKIGQTVGHDVQRYINLVGGGKDVKRKEEESKNIDFETIQKLKCTFKFKNLLTNLKFKRIQKVNAL